MRWRKKRMPVRRTCISIMPSPNRIWSRLSPSQTQAQGDLAAAEAALKVMGITNPDALVKAPPSFEALVKSPISGEVVEQNVAVGQLAADWRDPVLHAFRHQHRLGIGEHLSKGFAIRARRRCGHDPDRVLSRRLPWPYFLRRSFAGSEHAHTAGAH